MSESQMHSPQLENIYVLGAIPPTPVSTNSSVLPHGPPPSGAGIRRDHLPAAHHQPHRDTPRQKGPVPPWSQSAKTCPGYQKHATSVEHGVQATPVEPPLQRSQCQQAEGYNACDRRQFAQQPQKGDVREQPAQSETTDHLEDVLHPAIGWTGSHRSGVQSDPKKSCSLRRGEGTLCQVHPETQPGHMGNQTTCIPSRQHLSRGTQQPVVEIGQNPHPAGLQRREGSLYDPSKHSRRKGEPEREDPELPVTTPIGKPEKAAVVCRNRNMKVSVRQIY